MKEFSLLNIYAIQKNCDSIGQCTQFLIFGHMQANSLTLSHIINLYFYIYARVHVCLAHENINIHVHTLIVAL